MTSMITTTANLLLRSQTVALFRLKSSYAKTCVNSFVSTTTLTNKITLHRCCPMKVTTTETIQQSMTLISQRQSVVKCSQPLVILMGWTLAKDKHLEKYRQMWFTRGFDVLTVRTSPIDFLVPPIGGHVVANGLANYLLKTKPRFDRRIVIHTFSAGCYQLALLLSKLRSSDKFDAISKSIDGVICDSIVHIEDFAAGLPQVITTNPVLQSLLERSFHVLWKVFLAKNFECATHEMYNLYVRCPALVLYSENDVISSAKEIRKLISAWNKLGMYVQSKCWNTSVHVSHYLEHTLEYEQQIDAFLESINLRNDVDS